MVSKAYAATKLNKQLHVPHCPVCDGIIYESDEYEYVRTKRATDIFIHSDCVKNWGKCDGTI